MDKKTLLESIDESKTYKAKEVKNLINSVSAEVTKPLNLARGDVFLNNVGRKKRPCVVINIVENLVLAVPLTTTSDDMAFEEYSSRFLGVGCFTKQIISVPFDYALNNYITILDDIGALDAVHQKLKDFYNKYL